VKYTKNFGLKKPNQEDFYNVDDFNYNADIIDAQLADDSAWAQFITSESVNIFDAF